MKKIFGIIILSVLFFSFLVFLPKQVLGAIGAGALSPSPSPTETGSGKIPLPTDKPSNLPANISIPGVIQTVFKVIVSVGEVAFIIMLLVGGVMYITAGGDEEGAKKARKMITNAIIGIVILLSAWAIASWVVDTLNGIK